MTKLRPAAVWVAVFAMVLAACGGDDAADTTTTAADDTPTTEAEATTTTEAEEMDDTTTTEAEEMGEMSELGLPIIDPLDVPDGEVLIAGSSTVFPLSTALLSKWEDEGGPNYPIDSIGSGGGFERFCVEGASDISNASRAIKEEEREACQEIGRDPIEIRVGTDALTVVISSTNYFAQEMSIEELATAFSLTDPGATWADVNPDYPAHPIQVFSPGEDSGTFDYFNEVVFDEADPSPISASIAQIVGEDDNVTVQGVSGDGCEEGDVSSTCAIGYFGFAFFAENADVLTAVAVDGVAPSDDSVNEGTYPIARPLFMYTAPSVLEEKPQVASFIAYYLNNVNEVIGDVGYFPAPMERLQGAADAISEAAGF